MSLHFDQVQSGCAGVLLAGLLATSFGASAATLAETATPPAWQTPVAKTGAEYARLEREAQAVTITRDDWGIPHIHGKTYKVRLSLEDNGQKLDVRGYVGMPMLGRTQTWIRKDASEMQPAPIGSDDNG